MKLIVVTEEIEHGTSPRPPARLVEHVAGVARCSCGHFEPFKAMNECEALKIRKMRHLYPCSQCSAAQLLASFERQRISANGQ